MQIIKWYKVEGKTKIFPKSTHGGLQPGKGRGKEDMKEIHLKKIHVGLQKGKRFRKERKNTPKTQVRLVKNTKGSKELEEKKISHRKKTESKERDLDSHSKGKFEKKIENAAFNLTQKLCR